MFTEEILGVGGEVGEGEIVPPPERSFWAKYVSINRINCLHNFLLLIVFIVSKK